MTNPGLAKPIRRREAGVNDELKARIDDALATLDDALDGDDHSGQPARRRSDDGSGTSRSKQA